MGNGYDGHHGSERVFLPKLCRLSIKDVRVGNHRSYPISDAEPLSPRVTCTGQVKRNNRITGFPITNHNHRNTKLAKNLSGKTLLPTATVMNPNPIIFTAAVPRTAGRSCITEKRRLRMNTLSDHSGDRDSAKEEDVGETNLPVTVVVEKVDVGDMDPPLPVIKRSLSLESARGEVNLWKRRFKEEGLESLELEFIQSTNRKFRSSPITTV